MTHAQSGTMCRRINSIRRLRVRAKRIVPRPVKLCCRTFTRPRYHKVGVMGNLKWKNCENDCCIRAAVAVGRFFFFQTLETVFSRFFNWSLRRKSDQQDGGYPSQDFNGKRRSSAGQDELTRWDTLLPCLIFEDVVINNSKKDNM